MFRCKRTYYGTAYPRWGIGIALLTLMVAALVAATLTRPDRPADREAAIRLREAAQRLAETAPADASTPDDARAILDRVRETALTALSTSETSAEGSAPDDGLRDILLLLPALAEAEARGRLAVARERALLQAELADRADALDGAAAEPVVQRLRRTVIDTMTWAGPWGTLAYLAAAFVLVFVPPAELMRPFAWIVGRLKGLSVAGMRIDLSRDAIRSEKAEIAFATHLIGSMIAAHYLHGANKFDLEGHFARFVEAAVGKLDAEPAELNEYHFRATLHVPYYLMDHQVFQIEDYHDARGRRLIRQKGRGRHFSARKGIIGRCWRERRPRYDPEVTNSPDSLVKAWGMTRDEAEQASGDPKSMATVRLFDKSGDQIALVFMDARKPRLFRRHESGDPDDIDAEPNTTWAETLEARLRALPQTPVLVNALMAVRDEVGWDTDGRIMPESN